MTFQNISHDQHLAIDLGVDNTNRIIGITGEAGTGKTTVLGETANILADRGFSFALAAPTGRAAARIKEHTGFKGKTIHRLLGWGKPDETDPDDTGIPSRDRFNPIPVDYILIDEASMVSTELARALYNAMRPGSCIRFYGDAQQLPPVEGDSPFISILSKYPSVTLQDNFRSQSGIIKAARSIIQGLVPAANDEVSILNVGTQMSLTVLNEFLGPDFKTSKSQVIIPTKIGRYGTIAVNAWLQEQLNPSNRSLYLQYTLQDGVIQAVTLRPGDKILWTKNDYNLNLFNGMIGTCIDFDENSGDIVVSFDGKDQTIPPILEQFDQNNKSLFRYDPRKYIDLAYAITTHKSQGSEFDKTIILLNQTAALVRANFYTAITRAKKHVTVIAGRGGMQAAMRKSNGMKRNDES